MSRLAAALVSLAFLLAAPLAGLDDRAITQFTVRGWGPEEGLPSASVAIQGIVQDRDGYLWVGTTEGLARFDGVRFRIFDKSNTPAFGENEIHALLPAESGGLWVALARGGLYRLRDGRAEPVAAVTEKLKPHFELGDGDVMVSALDGVFHLADGARAPFGPAELRGQWVLGAERDDRGRVWFALRDGRTRIWDGGATIEAPLPPPGRTSDPVLLIRSADGSLVASTGRRGVWRQAAGGELEPLIVAPPWRGERARVLPLADGDLWAAPPNDGIWRRRRGHEAFERLLGLRGDRAVALFEDREQTLWAGTWNGGLTQVLDGPFTVFTRRDGLVSDSGRTLLESSDGSIWFGATGGLARISPSGQVENVELPASLPKGASWVTSLLELAPDDLLVATSAGLFRRSRGRWAPFAGGAVPPVFVFSLLRERAGELWAAFVVDPQGRGPSLHRLRGDRFEPVAGVTEPVFALLEGASGRRWAGSLRGLFELAADGTARRLELPVEGDRDLVASLAEDARGDLWVGTLDRGLMRLEKGDSARAVHFTKARDGLFDDTAWAIVDDGLGHLWISCSKGVYRLTLADVDDYLAGRAPRLRWRELGVDDGLVTRVFEGGNGSAGLRAHDGRLWFVSMQGAAVVDPRRLGDLAPPPARLDEVRVDGERQEARRELRLPAGRHRLELEYTAIHLRAPQKLRFRYRLTGLETAWQEAGALRRAEFPGLGRGDYRFEVQASLDGERWGEGAVLAVAVAPYFWQRAWFAALVALALIGLGVAFQRARMARLRERAHELERLVEFGRRIAGVLEPDELRRQLERALVERWGEVPWLIVARREGRAPLVAARGLATGAPPAIDEPELKGLADAAWLAGLRGENAPSRPGVSAPLLAQRLTASGLALLAPLRSGETTFGMVAVGGRRPRKPDAAGRARAHLASLAAQAATALEGAWQAQEAVRWRELSAAREEWLHRDLLSRLAFAVVAREGLEVAATTESVRQAIAGVLGEQDPSLARVARSVEDLVGARVLARDPDGRLRVERSSWLLLPEIRAPLAEIARRGMQRVGAYLLGERLGSGGMGEVFRATNVHDGSPAAVKLLFAAEAADAVARRRLEREGEIVARLSHPNVVRLLARGEHEGRLFLAMELLSGVTLAERLRRGPLAPRETAAVARQVALALAELHRHGVVHRDVKSANVMLEPQGRAVLLDLGLARGLGGSTLTESLAVIGTLPYMAPERLAGGEADERSDLWSLGVVAAESLLGRLPFREGASTFQLALEIARLQTPPDLGELESAPFALRSLLRGLLTPDPARRLASAAEAAERFAALEA